MKKHFFTRLLFSICLVGVAGTGTHALLMLHVQYCHKVEKTGTHSESHQQQTPAHDRSHCFYCQMFLGAGGKYIAPPTAVGLTVHTVVLYTVCYRPQSCNQYILACANPRGPPRP